MRGMGDFQRAQMKHRDARIFAMAQHLRAAVDLWEETQLHPFKKEEPSEPSPPPPAAPPVIRARRTLVDETQSDSRHPAVRLAALISDASEAHLTLSAYRDVSLEPVHSLQQIFFESSRSGAFRSTARRIERRPQTSLHLCEFHNGDDASAHA